MTLSVKYRANLFMITHQHYRYLAKWDYLALLIAVLSGIATGYISLSIYEGIPHIEDEIAYIWEAKAIAGGHFILESPPCPECFQVPFVIDYRGNRFGKYPLGWPVLLSFGVRFGIRNWIPPILSVLIIWFVYRLSRKLTAPGPSIITVILVATSPFYLMNVSSLLAHGWCLLLTVIFIIGWFDTFHPTNKIPVQLSTCVSGLSLGVLALTRPMTALGVGLPFMIHGLFTLIRGPAKKRRGVFWIGILSISIASLHFLWRYACTGDPLINPYTLWWPYDKVGFGQGIGLQEGGFTLRDSWVNTKFSLWVGQHDLFGWPYLSGMFLIPGILSMTHQPKTWPIIGIPFGIIFVYSFYWIGSWLLGPRYYFESIFSLAFISAIGMKWFIGEFIDSGNGKKRGGLSIAGRVITKGVIITLMVGNLLFYLPIRLGGMHGYYGFSKAQLMPFLSPAVENFTPALIIVHKINSWKEYGALLELSDPYYSTPLVFSLSLGDENDQKAILYFPQRSIWHYYSDDPYKLFSSEK